MELTTTEAAARLGIKPVTVRWLCASNHIIARKAGRDWLIPETEIERYAVQRKSRGRPRIPRDDHAPLREIQGRGRARRD